MFPINRVSQAPYPSQHYLYIPLCFLLIKKSEYRSNPGRPPLHSTMFPINPSTETTFQMAVSTLHSTMFPINRRKGIERPMQKPLYIPLCFLLIVLRIDRSIARCFLYIPLCFLLIEIYAGEGAGIL